MDRVRKRIHLEELYEYRGNRAPVTIAVLDSGISHHPDLEGKTMAFKDFVHGQKEIYDDNGHGTHVCGILCGSGETSSGKYRGIIPGSRLVVGKVLNAKGEGRAEIMLQGLEWVLRNRKYYDIRLLNISIGIGNLKEKWKSEQIKGMIEQIWDAGVVVVCAAGNKGPSEGSISDIGVGTKVIAVGCCDDAMGSELAESCERFSGRGNRRSSVRKPDLVAPGTNIISCSNQFRRDRNGYGNLYESRTGTSMATPIVTGCGALLLQAEPFLSNDKVKERLQFTAEDLGKPWILQGWGMVNVKSLIEKT